MVDAVLPVGTTIIISLISLVITVPLSALALFLSGKIFKEEIGYGKAIIPALIIGVVGLVLGLIGPLIGSISIIYIMYVVSFLVGLALYLTLPKLILNLEWKKGLLIGLVWFAIMFAISFVIGFIMVFVMVVIGSIAIW